MKLRLSLMMTLLVLTAGLAVACDGGDGDNGVGDGGNGNATNGTDSVPTDFEALRDELRGRLDAFGVNIGAVPDDVRDQILAQCRELASFVDSERVEAICGDIERAMERGDPGLIDLVLNSLAELEPD